MTDGEFLALAFESSPFRFEKFDLGDDPLFKGVEGVEASLLESGDLALGGGQLAVAVGSVEKSTFDFLEGLEGGATVEGRSFIGDGALDLDRRQSLSIVDWNIKARTDGGDPIAKSGSEGDALSGDPGSERKRGEKMKPSGFLELKGGADASFGGEKIRSLRQHGGGGAVGKGRGRGRGKSSGRGRGRRGPAEEGAQLQVGQSPKAIEIEKGARESLVFCFLTAKGGGRNEAHDFPVPHGGNDFTIGGNGLGDEGTFFIESENAEVRLGDLSGDEEATAVKIPEGGLFFFAGRPGGGPDAPEEVEFPGDRPGAGPGLEVNRLKAGRARLFVAVEEAGSHLDGWPVGRAGLLALCPGALEASSKNTKGRIVSERGGDARIETGIAKGGPPVLLEGSGGPSGCMDPFFSLLEHLARLVARREFGTADEHEAKRRDRKEECRFHEGRNLQG